MTNEARSLKRIVLLTGLTIAIGNAVVSEACAATTTQTATHWNFSLSGDSAGFELSFSAFSGPGTLTEVDLFIDSTWSASIPSTASVSLDGRELVADSLGEPTPPIPFDYALKFNTPGSLAIFQTNPVVVELALSPFETSCSAPPCATLASDDSEPAPTGVTLEYVYTPLPAALPLFATGIGALGLLGWRRKRKAQAVA